MTYKYWEGTDGHKPFGSLSLKADAKGVQGKLEGIHQQSAALASQVESLQEQVQTMEAAVERTVHEAACCQVISEVKLLQCECMGWVCQGHLYCSIAHLECAQLGLKFCDMHGMCPKA